PISSLHAELPPPDNPDPRTPRDTVRRTAHRARRVGTSGSRDSTSQGACDARDVERDRLCSSARRPSSQCHLYASRARTRRWPRRGDEKIYAAHVEQGIERLVRERQVLCVALDKLDAERPMLLAALAQPAEREIE